LIYHNIAWKDKSEPHPTTRRDQARSLSSHRLSRFVSFFETRKRI